MTSSTAGLSAEERYKGNSSPTHRRDFQEHFPRLWDLMGRNTEGTKGLMDEKGIKEVSGGQESKERASKRVGLGKLCLNASSTRKTHLKPSLQSSWWRLRAKTG